MKNALVAAVGSLLFSLPALADDSPAKSPSAEAPRGAVAADAASTPTPARTEKAAVPKSRRASADNAANTGDASQVKQLQLKAPGDRTVCRTEYPTGSRIGVKRCYSTTETATSKAEYDIMQHDLQEMRDRQLREQLQRASVGITPPMQSSPSR